MTAALSRYNELLTATVFSLGGTATSYAFDPAYPQTNAIKPDPTLEFRANVVKGGTTSDLFMRFAWSAAGPFTVAKTIRTVGLASLYISDLTKIGSVSIRVLSAAAGTLYSTVAFTPAQLVPIEDAPGYYNIYGTFAVDATAYAVDIVFNVLSGSSLAIGGGYLWAGPALVFPDGVDSDWSLGFVDPTDNQRPDGGGGPLGSPMPIRAVLTCPVTARTYAETFGVAGQPAFESMRRVLQTVGKSRPVLLIARDGDMQQVQVMSLYGSLRDLRDLGHQGGNYFESQFEVEQIR